LAFFDTARATLARFARAPTGFLPLRVSPPPDFSSRTDQYSHVLKFAVGMALI
jgi:hypothetical protein